MQILPLNETFGVISHEFSTIHEECFSKQVIEKGLNENDLFTHLKPHIFDSLKKLNRLSQMIKLILEFVCINKCGDRWKHLKHVEERDLICLVIKTLNSISRAKFGDYLVKNDYPCPIMFNDYEISFLVKVPKRYNICFDLFPALLGIVLQKSLIINSGTKSCSFKGKSSLLPLLFDGVNNNNVFISRKQNMGLNGNVDLICSSNEYIIADFHSEIESVDGKNLLKSFIAYSSMHIINATLEDFKGNGEFINELQEIFEWYKVLKLISSFEMVHVVILIRDYEEHGNELLSLIQQRHSSDFLSVLAVPCIADLNNYSNQLEVKQLNVNLNATMSKLRKKSFHSINDIQNLYENLCNNIDFDVCFKPLTVEFQFYDLFKDFESKTNEAVFPIASKNFQIYEVEETLNRIGYYHEKRDELDFQLNELKSEMRHINPFSQYILFFIEIIIDQNFTSNVVIFENLLIDLKKDKIESLRKCLSEKNKELDQLCNKIKQFDLMSNSDELSALKEEQKSIQSELRHLNNQIEKYDLTIDKFWDEIFSTYDWILDMEMRNISFTFSNIDNDVQEFKNKMPLLISRYIELLQQGSSIHLLRGTPLKIQSKALEMVFERLNSNQELYIARLFDSYFTWSTFNC